MLTAYGAENKGQTELMLNCCRCTGFLTLSFLWKGRTFMESFGGSLVSKGKETREKGGHKTVQSVLDVVISGKHRTLWTPTI